MAGRKTRACGAPQNVEITDGKRKKTHNSGNKKKQSSGGGEGL